MGLILNIETSGHNCSVALHNKGVLLANQINNEGLKHAEVLHLMMASVFKTTDIGLKDLQGIAISAGPGSYTGLRIGASAAKGLCYALDIPLIAINTLSIYAQTLIKNLQAQQESIITSIDARRDEIYFAVFENGYEIMVSQAKVLDESFHKLFDTNKKFILTGDGADKTWPYLEQHLDLKKIELKSIEAKYMNALSLNLFEKQSFVNAAYFEPNYLKPFFTTAKLKG
jgi:tRNA threonylcarbamoyladenosine biosynthesis protein TsaB